MRRIVLTAALTMWAVVATLVQAQSTPAPPDWDDASASVYLGMKSGGEPNDVAVHQPAATARESVPAVPSATATARREPAVFQAAHSEAPKHDTNDENRQLPPPTMDRWRNRVAAGATNPGATADRLPAISRPRTPIDSIYTIATALAVVIGGFLVFVWVLRRGTRRHTTALPPEVVSVLGRLPLAGRQFAELLRVGNKLVLVSLSPAGAEALTEITDPAEVDRLVGLCQQEHTHSTTKAFEHVFRQLSRDTTPGGFLGSDLLSTSSPAATGYGASRGEAAHA